MWFFILRVNVGHKGGDRVQKNALKRQSQALDAKSKAWLIGFGLEGKPRGEQTLA
ncbi:Hypothetical protein FORC77_2939 [Vibrio vulnificus]|nr:Hypothetical protein FORC77_2939 [Vibrio vulnificus]